MSFAKNIDKNIGKNKCKNVRGKYSQKLLYHANYSAKDAIKTASKRLIQKTAEATFKSKVIKSLIKLQKSQKIHNNIIQKELQMSMIKKYQKKDIYLQKKGRKLLMI